MLKNHSELFELERILFNFPDNADSKGFINLYPDALVHIPQTGETLQFGDVSVDILYTHEDDRDLLTSAYTYESRNEGFNDTSTVIRINFDGKTCLILGDVSAHIGNILESHYSAEQLQSDVIQIAHHGVNPMHNFYAIVDAKIGLVPNHPTDVKKEVAPSLESSCDELYYGGEETVGIRVIDGEVQAFYHRPIIYTEDKMPG